MKVIFIIWNDWKQIKTETDETDETTVTALKKTNKKKSLNIYFENSEKWQKHHQVPPGNIYITHS